MYIIRVYVRRVKHTWVLARSTSGTVSVRTAEWQTKIFGSSVCSKVDSSTKASQEIERKKQRQNSNCKNKIQVWQTSLCSFHEDETYRNKSLWLADSQAAGFFFFFLPLFKKSAKIQSTGDSGVKLKNCTRKHEVQSRLVYTCILVRHLGPPPPPEKPNTIMCQLFFFFSIGKFSVFAFFVRRKIIYWGKK